ncbi:G2/M phase-specific E3 ubiquitin-protein ligase isoform X4 [Danio rerio]
MSSGICQRGEEDEDVYGFLVGDIKKEIRRSSRLRCFHCKKAGASVGCSIKSCRQMVHMPCGLEQEFVFQFTGLFPSFCKKHAPTQSCDSSHSLPHSCSICLDPIEPILSYHVLKCPACHGSWFHRKCVQNYAHSAAMFFFKCTLCNNKEQFQQEMLRMGIYIPERDASWELEENAFVELLQVYHRCDAVKCLCHKGREHSSQSGYFEIVLCKLCGSRGTHRKCSNIRVYEADWIFREGLRTLGMFEQVQMCSETFFPVFCGPVERLTAESVMELFTTRLSEEKEKQVLEKTTISFWKQYLHECEEGQCAASLEDLLTFATGTDLVPAIGFKPTPSISFLSSPDNLCAFPQSNCDANHLILPTLPSYQLFKKHLDYTVCQFSVMQDI